MSPRAASPAPRRPSEKEVVATAATYLAGKGYRVYTNPDSTDYFDLVVRRGDEVGLVEAKVANGRAVLAQALRRRAWGDWVAVVLPSETTAARLVARTTGTRAAPVGVWSAHGGSVRVLREARPWPRSAEDDPFTRTRERFRAVLDRIDSGEIPADLRWEGVVRAVRRAGGGRGFAEWRLDEPFGP